MPLNRYLLQEAVPLAQLPITGKLADGRSREIKQRPGMRKILWIKAKKTSIVNFLYYKFVKLLFPESKCLWLTTSDKGVIPQGISSRAQIIMLCVKSNHDQYSNGCLLKITLPDFVSFAKLIIPPESFCSIWKRSMLPYVPDVLLMLPVFILFLKSATCAWPYTPQLVNARTHTRRQMSELWLEVFDLVAKIGAVQLRFVPEILGVGTAA